MNVEELEVRHNAEKHRFEIWLGSDLAFAEYIQAGNVIIFTHTEVPVEFEGKGVAGRLAKFALDYAVQAGYQIQPLCPYINAYIKRHAEYQPHVRL